MPLTEVAGAICVQRFDDSRNSAIHTTYRISLRSSSLREPRYPLLRVVFCLAASIASTHKALEIGCKVGVYKRVLHNIRTRNKERDSPSPCCPTFPKK